MNKKIKVIDLLNMIANGEEVPEKVKYQNEIWKYCKDLEDYLRPSKETTLFTMYYIHRILNNEIEVIQEPKKIEKIEIYDKYTNHQNLHSYIEIYDDKDDKIKKFVVGAVQREMIIKLNEIIDRLNEML